MRNRIVFFSLFDECCIVESDWYTQSTRKIQNSMESNTSVLRTQSEFFLFIYFQMWQRECASFLFICPDATLCERVILLFVRWDLFPVSTIPASIIFFFIVSPFPALHTQCTMYMNSAHERQWYPSIFFYAVNPNFSTIRSNQDSVPQWTASEIKSNDVWQFQVTPNGRTKSLLPFSFSKSNWIWFAICSVINVKINIGHKHTENPIYFWCFDKWTADMRHSTLFARFVANA